MPEATSLALCHIKIWASEGKYFPFILQIEEAEHMALLLQRHSYRSPCGTLGTSLCVWPLEDLGGKSLRLLRCYEDLQRRKFSSDEKKNCPCHEEKVSLKPRSDLYGAFVSSSREAA